MKHEVRQEAPKRWSERYDLSLEEKKFMTYTSESLPLFLNVVEEQAKIPKKSKIKRVKFDLTDLQTDIKKYNKPVSKTALNLILVGADFKPKQYINNETTYL